VATTAVAALPLITVDKTPKNLMVERYVRLQGSESSRCKQQRLVGGQHLSFGFSLLRSRKK
jgi:hypothetical protein